MKIKNSKVFLSTKHHRNNTNFNYKSSQKEHYITIYRKYYTTNNKKTYRYNIKKTKPDIGKINKIVIIKKYRNINNNKTNKTHNNNINVKTNYKSNIYLNIWKLTYYNKTKNIWQECQPHRIRKWYNHYIVTSIIKTHTNNNPIKTNKIIDIKYIIKTKYLKVTYLNQNTKTYYYPFDRTLILLKSGDIETNPGPMPNILETHPSPHRQRYKTYFITCTIKLQPEYQHLTKTFSPILKIDHPHHINATRNFPHLTRYLSQKRQHLAPRLLFSLITTISPDIHSCEHQLRNIPNLDWTTTLLDRMATLRNPPERHINTLHPYTEFLNNHKNMINPPPTIHNELFDFIRQETVPITIHTLTEKFSFLPNSLLNEALRIYELLNEYSHPPPILQIPPPPTPSVIQSTNNNTQIISWNASSLNTALPNLHDIIRHTNPAIIAIQETKLTATKSTKYIQNLYPQYKLIFNNTHALTRCIQQRIPYTPARGGLLTLINHKYAFPGNITKIPSPANISPYLQTIHIKTIHYNHG